MKIKWNPTIVLFLIYLSHIHPGQEKYAYLLGFGVVYLKLSIFQAPFRAIIDHSQSQPSFSDTNLPQQMNTKFFEPSEAPSIIFSPPNAIQSWPEQRPPTQPDPNNYRPPIKAAGIHFTVLCSWFLTSIYSVLFV